MPMRFRPLASGVIAAFALACVLIGCVNSAEADDTERDATIYRAVIADVADRSGVVLDGSEDLPVLFIEAFDPDGIDLEVQVELVSAFVEQYEIRFIDDRDEAVDLDVDDMPVRANSLLIGLGPVVVDGRVDVRSELYLSREALSAHRYTFAGRDDRWTLVGAPEEIEPEGFVAAS